MFLRYEGKKHGYFDNLVYSWLIKSTDNEWRIVKRYMGAFDEDGNEDINRSMGCEIALYELNNNTPHITRRIKERAENELDIEFIGETNLVKPFEFRDSFFYTDYSDFNRTDEIFNTLLSSLLRAIIEEAFRKVA